MFQLTNQPTKINSFTPQAELNLDPVEHRQAVAA